MKLVVAIVLSDDADKIVKALLARGFRGPTRISTVGGFLRRGNVTLLLAVEADRVDEALALMREHAQPRTITGSTGATPFRGAAFVIPIEQLLPA
ncbi:MAG TPA: cyclic-di-AMP receptor [Chloroflexota bacterium]|jgi:uncharacterized protein YaaQ|nr:cyclic-di-AMP receptor [Chloroflexota bacterium]